MAENKKISQLPEDVNLDGGENLVTEENGSNYRITLTTVKDWVLNFITVAFLQGVRPLKTINNESLEGEGNIDIEWGNITGTLSNQTDLQNVLNNKINSLTDGEPTGSNSVLNVVSLTQAEYDAGTPIATTLYIITDA